MTANIAFVRHRPMIVTAMFFVAAAASLLVFSSASHAQSSSSFTVEPPGKLKYNYGSGVKDPRLFAPRMLFPIGDNLPTTVTSQVANPGGFYYHERFGKWGDECDTTNFNEHWWDTLCEKRSKLKQAAALGCRNRNYHQGIDINGGTASQCKKLRQAHRRKRRLNLVPIIAVADGRVYLGKSYSVNLKLRDDSKFTYLHMNMVDLRKRWPRRGMKIKAGALLGYMWKDFGYKNGKPRATTFHLHLEHWKSLTGRGFRPVPLYCDLVRAYERSRNKVAKTPGGMKCATVDGSDPLVGLDVTKPQPIPETGNLSDVQSYWSIDRHGSGGQASALEHGLAARGHERTIIVTDANADAAKGLQRGAIVFSGRKEGNTYRGTYRMYRPSCPPQLIAVNGPVSNNDRRITLHGTVRETGEYCKLTNAKSDLKVSFDFLRPRVSENGEETALKCGLTSEPVYKSELTYNWTALTIKAPPSGWHKYIRTWPGLRRSHDGAPIGIQIDKNEGRIPAMETPEAGVAIWYYWLLVRKGYGSRDGTPASKPTLTKLARGIAGNDATAAALRTYLDEYKGLSRLYFDRELGVNEPIDISDRDVLWSFARMMFHHESSRKPIIRREAFERGIWYGRDVIAKAFEQATQTGADIGTIDLTHIVDPTNYACAEEPSSQKPGDIAGSSDLSTHNRLRLRIAQLAQEQRILCTKLQASGKSCDIKGQPDVPDSASNQISKSSLRKLHRINKQLEDILKRQKKLLARR